MDEPTNWELARRLEEIQRTLDGAVHRPEYAADQRASQFRLGEVERDLAEERRERAAADSQERADRAEAVREVQQRITDQAKAGVEHRMHWRSLLWTGALPALVALIGVLVTLLLAHHGGLQMRRWQYGAASSAIAVLCAVGAVAAANEIEGQHGTASRGRSPLPLAGQSPPARSTTPARPGARSSPGARQRQPSQTPGPMLAAELDTPSASGSHRSGSGTSSSTGSGRPTSTPTPQPSTSSTEAAPPPPTPTPTPTVTVTRTTAPPSPSSTCVLGVNALGIQVCVPDRLGG